MKILFEKRGSQKSPSIFSWHIWGLAFVCLIFLAFGLNHLGRFITVDEEKWLLAFIV